MPRRKINKSVSKRKKRNNYISLQDATRYCSYSQEYLSLRARQGKLKAEKQGRNWFTTKDWLNDYIAKAEDYKKIVAKTETLEILIKPIIEEKPQEIKKELEPVLVSSDLLVVNRPLPPIIEEPGEIEEEVEPEEIEPEEIDIETKKPTIHLRLIMGLSLWLIFAFGFFFFLMNQTNPEFLKNSYIGKAFNKISGYTYILVGKGDQTVDETAQSINQGLDIVYNDMSDSSKDISIGIDIVQYSFKYTIDTFTEYFKWLGKGINQIPNGIKKISASIIYPFKSFPSFISNLLDFSDEQTIRTNKLELIDEKTGETYCTWIEDGEWKKIQNKCK